MMKTVAVLLVLTLLCPTALFAAPADEDQQQPAGETRPAPATVAAARDNGYSPTAEKAYLGTAIGTLVGGGAFLALGVSAGNSDDIASDAAATVLYVIGGSFLVTSGILWIFYFREKGKEPATTVGFELDKRKVGIQAQFRF